MGVNLSKTSNVIFFAAILPLASYFIARGFHQLFPDIPFWMETISPLFAYGVLYALFEKYLWHWRIFKFFGLVNVPDLRGRWKGKQRSSYKENGSNIEIPSCLEISQTFSKIIVRACYERSQSQSVVANFAELNGENYLFYTYDSEPNSLKSGTMQAHKGTVKLKYLPKEKKLIGAYFNSIGNGGELEFEFEQYDLLGRFAK